MARPRLNIDHLAALAALDEGGGVSQAARLLHISQPAFSYRVQELERRCGVALFGREGRSLRWTPAGLRLLESARRILKELETAESDCRMLGAGVREIVRVGSRASGNFRWLPRVLGAFGQSHADVTVELVPSLVGAPLQALLEGAVDVDIVAGKVTHPELVARALFSDELVALVSANHPLAGKAFVTAQDLAPETYVTYSSTPEPGLEHDLLFQPAGLSPARFVQVGLTEAVVEMVRANYGVSVLSRWAIAGASVQPGLRALRVTRAGLAIRWFAVVRKSSPASGAAVALMKELLHAFKAGGLAGVR